MVSSSFVHELVGFYLEFQYSKRCMIGRQAAIVYAIFAGVNQMGSKPWNGYREYMECLLVYSLFSYGHNCNHVIESTWFVIYTIAIGAWESGRICSMQMQFFHYFDWQTSRRIQSRELVAINLWCAIIFVLINLVGLCMGVIDLLVRLPFSFRCIPCIEPEITTKIWISDRIYFYKKYILYDEKRAKTSSLFHMCHNSLKLYALQNELHMHFPTALPWLYPRTMHSNSSDVIGF